MNFIVSAVTDKGCENENNQDSLAVRSVLSSYGHICMAVICDGLGGLSNGEVASAHVVLKLSDWFSRNAHHIKNLKMATDITKKILIEANRELAEYGKEKGIAVGTTATVLFVMNKKYAFVHVGDTRIYKISSRCKLLTKDHCINESMLTQCVGGSELISPQCSAGNVGRGDVFLLCSDGFRHKNSEKIFTTYYKKKNNHNEEDLRLHTKMLVERCRYLGEKDNITAALIKVSN